MVKKRAPQTPWYKEEAGFFGTGYLQEQEGNISQEITIKQVNFLEKALDLVKGVKIFDCPCGHGRHSIELARRGYNVVGQDINGFFLKEAKKSAKHAKVLVRWIKKDMREVSFENEFNVALNLFSSFGYLESDDEDQKVLNAATKTLKHSGKFVLDVINRERAVNNYQEKWQRLSSGMMIIVENRFDKVAGRNIEKRVRVWKNGKREEFSRSFRVYAISELVTMFQKAGLILKETYGNYNADPITIDSKRYILIAYKN